MAHTSRPSRATLSDFRAIIAELAAGAADLPPQQARKARAQLGEAVKDLERIRATLDPVRDPVSFFDPSNPSTVGRFAGIAMVAQERHALARVPQFYGSGVYALYYNGSFEPYLLLARSETPIYVGKADPKDANARAPRDQGKKLCARLSEHARSIRKASTTLAIEDFECRFLVVRSGWQMAAEQYLIELFKPIWNDETRICFGIGKHGDAPETRSNLRSPWDTLHPGRDWAHRGEQIADARSLEWIRSQLQAHFERHPPLLGIDAVLQQFYEDLRQ